MTQQNQPQTPAVASPINKLLLGAAAGFQFAFLAATWVFAEEDARNAVDLDIYWRDVYVFSALLVAGIAVTIWAFMQQAGTPKGHIIMAIGFAASGVLLAMGTPIFTLIYGGFAVWHIVCAWRTRGAS